jgi:hypothetical protein
MQPLSKLAEPTEVRKDANGVEVLLFKRYKSSKYFWLSGF